MPEHWDRDQQYLAASPRCQQVSNGVLTGHEDAVILVPLNVSVSGAARQGAVIRNVQVGEEIKEASSISIGPVDGYYCGERNSVIQSNGCTTIRTEETYWVTVNFSCWTMCDDDDRDRRTYLPE